MWIDGQWVAAESGKTYTAVNPATGEEIARIPLGDKADVFPLSVEASIKTLALPIYPELTRNQIGYVVDTIKEFEDIT